MTHWTWVSVRSLARCGRHGTRAAVITGSTHEPGVGGCSRTVESTYGKYNAIKKIKLIQILSESVTFSRGDVSYICSLNYFTEFEFLVIEHLCRLRILWISLYFLRQNFHIKFMWIFHIKFIFFALNSCEFFTLISCEFFHLKFTNSHEYSLPLKGVKCNEP